MYKIMKSRLAYKRGNLLFEERAEMDREIFCEYIKYIAMS